MENQPKSDISINSISSLSTEMDSKEQSLFAIKMELDVKSLKSYAKETAELIFPTHFSSKNKFDIN